MPCIVYVRRGSRQDRLDSDPILPEAVGGVGIPAETKTRCGPMAEETRPRVHLHVPIQRKAAQPLYSSLILPH